MRGVLVKRYGSFMLKLIAILLALSLPSHAIASQEGVLPFSEFTIKSNGIGQSGPVELVGNKIEAGYSSIIVNVFGKSYSFPKHILKQLSDMPKNGIQLSYEAGYKSLGGKTIYMQFQMGFTSGLKQVVVVSLNSQGEFNVLKSIKS